MHDRERNEGPERRVAAVVAVAVNAGLLALLPWLLRTPAIDAPSHASPTVEVRWIRPPVPAVRPPATDMALTLASPVETRRPPRTAVPDIDIVTGVEDDAGATLATAPESIRMNTAPWLQPQRPALGAPDPLANRRVDLPGSPGGRFRMREPPSLAGALAAVGRAFGGANYSTDPCPEVRRDIDDLSLQGDSTALRDALAYEQRFCR